MMLPVVTVEVMPEFKSTMGETVADSEAAAVVITEFNWLWMPTVKVRSTVLLPVVANLMSCRAC